MNQLKINLKIFSNIFLNESDLVIGDLGHAKQFSNKTTEKFDSKKFGTLLYNAPETFDETYVESYPDDKRIWCFTKAIDIWSFGCVVFEMIKLKNLFKNTTEILKFDVNKDLNAEDFESEFLFTILIK